MTETIIEKARECRRPELFQAKTKTHRVLPFFIEHSASKGMCREIQGTGEWRAQMQTKSSKRQAFCMNTPLTKKKLVFPLELIFTSAEFHVRA